MSSFPPFPSDFFSTHKKKSGQSGQPKSLADAFRTIPSPDISEILYWFNPHPPTAEGWTDRSIDLNNGQNYREALAAAETAIGLDATLAGGWAQKAISLRRLSRPSESLEASALAIGIDPKYPLIWHHRGMALYALDKYEMALAAFNQEIDGKVQPYIESVVFKGHTLMQMMRYEDAVSAFKLAREIDKTYPNIGGYLSDARFGKYGKVALKTIAGIAVGAGVKKVYDEITKDERDT